MNFTEVKTGPMGIWLWLGLESLLYAGFLIMDITGRTEESAYLKFISILLCFLFAAVYERNFLALSLGFSVVADIFLLFTENFIPGLLSFLLVQSLIGWYLIKKYGGSLRKQIGLRMILPLLPLWIIARQGVTVDLVCILACFYIVSFGCNVVCSIYGAWKNPSKSGLLLMIGLVLFFLCDINVGIFNLSHYVIVQSPWMMKLEKVSAIAMWFFYLPGQMMIGFSGMLRILEKKEKN